MIRIGVLGSEGGRMRGAVIEEIARAEGCELDAWTNPTIAYKTPHVLIDFTVPAAAITHVENAAAWGKPIVIGTTGLGHEERSAMATAARAVPVIYSANFSIGVNVLLVLAEQATAALGVGYDIGICDAHHIHKKDAPSGTALALQRATGRGEIVSLRLGDVVGDHTVTFAGVGERVELTHRATSRSIFAAGAVRAAKWAVDRPPGLYSMRDVLGL